MLAECFRDLLRMDESAARLTDRQLIQPRSRSRIVVLRLRRARVAMSFEPRQQRRERCAHLANDTEVHRRATTDVPGPQIHLRDARGIAVRIELAIRKVGAEHEQEIARAHGVVAGGKPDEAGHADVERVVPLDVLLAPHRVHDGRLQPLGKREQLGVRTLTTRAAQQGNAPRIVQQAGEPIELLRCRHNGRLARQQAADFGHDGIFRREQRHVARNHDHGHAALRVCLANSDLDRPGHRAGGSDRLAVVAAFAEQRLRPRFLEIARADFRDGMCAAMARTGTRER